MCVRFEIQTEIIDSVALGHVRLIENCSFDVSLRLQFYLLDFRWHL